MSGRISRSIKLIFEDKIIETFSKNNYIILLGAMPFSVFCYLTFLRINHNLLLMFEWS